MGGPSGFTLVEILIVLAIISIVLSMGLPAISRVTYQQLNSTSRRFVGLVRTIRNDAILLSTVHRLAVNLDEQTWWVEQQRKFELLSDSPEEAVQTARKKNQEPPPSNFIYAEKFGKKPLSLPDGVVFDGVFKQRDGVQREGVAYVHFFPNGYAEPATIFLNRAGRGSTPGYAIELQPPLGKVAIYRESIEAVAGNRK